MNPWIPVIVGLVINALVVAFAFGKWSQMLNDLKRRMGIEENQRSTNNVSREKWQDRMEDKQAHASHELLPECVRQFKEINAGINTLTGKVDTLISLGAHCDPPPRKK